MGKTRVYIFWFLLLSIVGGPLGAQEFRATLSGVVSDPSGAAIPKAAVTVINAATNVQMAVTTNNDGVYVVPFINAGTYDIKVQAQGFETLDRPGIVLGVADAIKLNLTLQVGSMLQTVTVSGAAPLVNTATAVSGQTISGQSITDLPLADGNPLALTHLAAGVAYLGSQTSIRAIDQGATSSFQVNGLPGANEFTLNGIPDMSSVGNVYPNGNDLSSSVLTTHIETNNTVAFVPPTDAVVEFKLAGGLFDAQYGHGGAADVNAVIKSGTNGLHGDVYEFDRNSAFFADSFFVNATGAAKPVERYNRYGGAVGGPVYIPKVYNGKDKTFFFFAYEGFTTETPTPGLTTVPTAAEKEGDFSALLPAGVTIYNPYTRVALPNGRSQVVDIEAMKKFSFSESKNLEIRVDFLNAANHPAFASPVVTPTSGTFSQSTSQINLPRNIQLGGWINF